MTYLNTFDFKFESKYSFERDFGVSFSSNFENIDNGYRFDSVFNTNIYISYRYKGPDGFTRIGYKRQIAR